MKAYIAPGTDSDLLKGDNFYHQILELGYDRFRFDGNGFDAWCRLWRYGEEHYSISVHGADLLYAAHAALNAAKVYDDVMRNGRLTRESDEKDH